MNSVIDAWHDQILAHERDVAALRGDGHEHGQGHGHRSFGHANRPLDPYRADDPVLNSLYTSLSADAEVLDVGGGAGRFALALATRAKHVTVVEPSADSVELLRTRAADAELANVTVINEPWEDAEAPPADMVLCSLVLHHVPDAGPFVAKMQEHARDRRSRSGDDGDARGPRGPLLRARLRLGPNAPAGATERAGPTVGHGHLP